MENQAERTVYHEVQSGVTLGLHRTGMVPDSLQDRIPEMSYSPKSLKGLYMGLYRV